MVASSSNLIPSTIFHVMKSERREGYCEECDTKVVASYTTLEDAAQAAERTISREGPFTSYKRSHQEIDDEELDGEDEDGKNDDGQEEDADNVNAQGYYIKARANDGTRWSVWVEQGKLYMPAAAQVAPGNSGPVSTASVQSNKPSTRPPTKKYVVYKELYHASGGIEKYDKKIHWETVYEDIHDANEAAQDMMYEFTEDFETEENAGSHTRPYSGSAELSPMFYNDPVQVSVRVIEAASVQQEVGRKRSRKG